MKLENVTPMNFSGIPFVFGVIAFSLIVLLPRVMSEAYWPLWILGWLILFASWGTGAEIEGDSIVLKYAFGVLKIKIPFNEIEEIAVLSRLQKGTIAKYFKWEIFLFMSFIVYAIFDLITLPRGLLKGYYFGDIGLIVWGLFYISAFTTPFSKKKIVELLVCILVPLEALALYLKTGSITGDDIFVLMSTAIILLIAIPWFYERDYIMIRTKKAVYLLECKNAGKIIKELLVKRCSHEA